MYKIVTELESISPYQQRKYVESQIRDKEAYAAYELRSWRWTMHTNGTGNMVIPMIQFKKALQNAGKFLRKKIKGEGQSEYTKHLKAGVMVFGELDTGIPVEDVEPNILHVPSDGKEGGTTRVTRYFPRIQHWKGSVEWHILDEKITPDVFKEHLIEAGQFIGIGVWRPMNGGLYGRFKVNGLSVFDSNGNILQGEKSKKRVAL